MTVAPTFFARPESVPIQLGVQPRLASWNASTHPDQRRLHAALDDAGCALAPRLGALSASVTVRLDVGLPPNVVLLDEHDLDNYAYPLANYLAGRIIVELGLHRTADPAIGDDVLIRVAARSIGQGT